MKNVIIQQIRGVIIERADLMTNPPKWFSPTLVSSHGPLPLVIDLEAGKKEANLIKTVSALQSMTMLNTFCCDVYDTNNSWIYRVVGKRKDRSNILALIMSATWFDLEKGEYKKPYANTKNLTFNLAINASDREWLITTARHFEIESQVQQQIEDNQGWQISDRKPLPIRFENNC